MNALKWTGIGSGPALLLTLLRGTTRSGSFTRTHAYVYNYHLCSSTNAARLVHTCACSYSGKRAAAAFRPKRPPETDTEYGEAEEPAAVNPSKGRSKIVMKNWDRHYAEVRRMKKAKPHGEDSKQRSMGLAARDAEEEVDDEVEERMRSEGKRADPTDEFGSLTIGETDVPVSDERSRMTKDQLKELESTIYSIDETLEPDDTRIVPEDLSERMVFRQLKIRTKALMYEGRLAEALDLFTHAMKAGGMRYDMQDLTHSYTELIAECGRAGHVKMALKLFKEMKERSCYVKPSVYTSLFNAFANSVGDREENLERLEKIRENMLDKGFLPNAIHYHCLIKAYGRLGQVQAAFAVVDEMTQKSISGDPTAKQRHLRGVRLTTETFNFLLSACISDKANGFRHALMTWKKMIGMRIAPDHYTFKLFLRAVRECGIVVPKSVRKMLNASSPVAHSALQIGDISEPDTEHDFKAIPPMMNSEIGFDENCALILSDLADNENEEQQQLALNSGGSELLHLLSNQCTPTKGIQELLESPDNRLAILGGLKAIVTEMRNFNVRADLKLLTELVQIVNPIDLQNIMFLLSENYVKPDTDFFNMMIKRHIAFDRIMDARNVLKLMHRSRLHPNVMTWGIFSLACKEWKNGKQLLRDIDSYKMEPNIQIMGGLLGTAVREFDPRYVLRVMEELRFRRLDPDAVFVEKVMIFRTVVQKGVVNHEQGLEVTPYALRKQLEENHENFMNFYTKFKLRYQSWVDSVPERVLSKVKNPEDVQDPWEDDFRNRIKSLKTAQQF